MSENLSSIKRHFKALKNLRSDLRSIIPMETYRGQGDLLVRTYNSLHQAIAPLLNDAVIDSLVISLPEEAKDREKAMQVSILVGQLYAHVESILEDMDTASEKPAEDGNEVIKRFRNVIDEN